MERGIKKVKLSFDRIVDDRESFLVEQCTGKRVLHIGCVGTRPVYESKTLHERLDEVSNYCVGVDLSEKGVDELTKKNPELKLLCKNAEDISASDIDGEYFDVVIFGEVLEHIENAGNALRMIKKTCSKFGAEVILTVPNAFGWRNFVAVLFQKSEITRLDHYCYYSPVTVSSLARDVGLKVLSTCVYSNAIDIKGNKRWIKQILINWVLLRVSPGLAEGLIFHIGSSE